MDSQSLVSRITNRLYRERLKFIDRWKRFKYFLRGSWGSQCSIGGFRFRYRNFEEYQRISHLFSKEPQTIRWIDDFFEPGDLFLDLGANIGTYSIYATSQDVEVHAFEPQFKNYASLNENIYLNGLSDNVKAYCVLVADHRGLDTFKHHKYSHGASSSQVINESDSQDVRFVQGTPVLAVDDVLKMLDSGDREVHVKIDVEGFEARVLKGMENSLENQRIGSLSIEAYDPEKVGDFLEPYGFVFRSQEASNPNKPDSLPANVIFERKDQISDGEA